MQPLAAGAVADFVVVLQIEHEPGRRDSAGIGAVRLLPESRRLTGVEPAAFDECPEVLERIVEVCEVATGASGQDAEDLVVEIERPRGSQSEPACRLGPLQWRQ